MWVFTKRGFISAVQNMDDPTGDTLILRSRAQGDLRAFRDRYMSIDAANQITYHSKNDYPFRMVVTRDEYRAALIASVDDIDYKNFKNAVAKTPGQGYERANIYNRIWSVMLTVEGALRKRRFAKGGSSSGSEPTPPRTDEPRVNEGPPQNPQHRLWDDKRGNYDDDDGIQWPTST